MEQIIKYGNVTNDEQGRFTTNGDWSIDYVIEAVELLMHDYEMIEISLYDELGQCDSVFKIERFV